MIELSQAEKRETRLFIRRHNNPIGYTVYTRRIRPYNIYYWTKGMST